VNIIRGARRLPSRTGRVQVLVYAARWLGAALLLELMSRTLYFNAIAKHGLLTHGVLARMGLEVRPYHFALTGFWVLIYMWLKVRGGGGSTGAGALERPACCFCCWCRRCCCCRRCWR